ncbi:TPA: molybdopterin-dependent oxidoreductase [Vibrio vulnificus]|uniref:molybdopterin-dependent oxidoreductase n=1 Tax=Vibrio vulnificus TaxID=672 RepID=UPI001023915B|nr:hypothetical protein D8T45_00200 [Vibrio vulnificus]RZR20109.1 hypothetical protein D8T24_02400 [Vibrio vulnificus]HAS6277964.1 molybdopterin-dependent oxidoreductase [Vibrio vulnificus]HDY7586351.1 molybdopterin-dependent oxidoreductase [Vibrio vulnificus]HDY7662927.1 molybdopterin-dependent oxidoreductase [Vibrio vulnificus]
MVYASLEMTMKFAWQIGILALLPTLCLAQIYPPPQGEVLLTISGNIDNRNSPDGFVLDRETLTSFEQVTIQTDNHVVASVYQYQGPRLSDLLSYVGAKGSELIVIAWDDYVATIPIEDVSNYPVILATHENGKVMTIDDKGPLFVVYPFSDNPELRFDLYYNRSVWQVREIKVE